MMCDTGAIVRFKSQLLELFLETLFHLFQYIQSKLKEKWRLFNVPLYTYFSSIY